MRLALLALLAGCGPSALRPIPWSPPPRAAIRMVPQVLPAEARFTAAALSRDGRLAVLGGADGSVVVLDPDRAVVLAQLATAHRGPIDRVRVRPDGDAVSVALDGTVCTIRPREGRVMGCRAGLGEDITAVDLSPDGRWLAVGARGAIYLWDLDAGRSLFGRPIPVERVQAIAVSHGGERVAATGPKGAARVWESAAEQAFLGGTTGRIVSGEVDALAFFPDGRLAMARDGEAWVMTTGPRPKVLHAWRHTEPVIDLLPSAGGLFVRRTRSLTTHAPGRRGEALPLSGPGPTAWARGHLLTVAERPDTPPALRWRPADGPARVLPLHFASNDVRFEAGRALFAGRQGGIALDLTTGMVDPVGPAAPPPEGALARRGPLSLRYAAPPPGGLFGRIDYRHAVEILDGQRRVGRLLTRSLVTAAAFTPDGRAALIADGHATGSDWHRGWVRRHAVRTGEETGRVPAPPGGVGALASAADTQRAIIGSAGLALSEPCCEVEVVDLASERVRTRLVGHRDRVRSVALSADQRYALSASADGTARLWRLEGDHPSVSLITADGEWLAYTEDGYFDASREGHRLALAVAGDRAFGVDQLAAHANRPDLILGRLGVGPAALHAQLRRLAERRGARALDGAAYVDAPEAHIISAIRHGDRVAVTARLSVRAGQLARYRVDMDGVPVVEAAAPATGAAGDPCQPTLPALPALLSPPGPTAVTIAHCLPLIAGPNRIEVSATSTLGLESLRALRTVTGPEAPRRRLYVLGMGVSDYARIDDLDFGAKDARDVVSRLAQAGGRGGVVEVRALTLPEAEVTRAGVEAAKAHFADAREDDIAVVFASGHGVLTPDAEARYVFATQDLDRGAIAATGAPFSLLEGLLSGIRPRHKLLLLDSCVSGERDPATEAPRAAAAEAAGLRAKIARGLAVEGVDRPAPRPWLLRRDRFIHGNLTRRTGAVVLSAARGDELAYEHPAWQNGAFTAELLCALSGEADRDGDGAISVAELRGHLSAAVAARTRGLQHPVVDRENIHARFSLPVIPGPCRR